jgi:phosphoribosylanthranilate isomerase
MFDQSSGTRIKVCCISSVQEAEVAILAGASAVGLVSEMPSGPGVISQDDIAEIAARVSPRVATFLLTSSTNPDHIYRQVRQCGVDVVQLADMLTPAGRERIRASLPGVAVVQVIHVTDDSAIDEAIGAEPTSDALLLDSGNPLARIRELGGTGRVHNWMISAKIRSAVRIPVILAGGLHAGNVADAIRSVRPFGEDLCSGVRTAGKLDEKKLALFVQAVRSADTQTSEQ